MSKILATIQSGQFSDTQIRQLEAAVLKQAAQTLGPGRRNIVWCLIPEGQAYTRYEASRSSLLTIEAQNGLNQEKRVALLKACEQEWTAITGQHSDQVMLAVLDQDKFSELLAANQQRLSRWGRLRFNLHLLTSLIRSKLSRGYLSFNPNL